MAKDKSKENELSEIEGILAEAPKLTEEDLIETNSLYENYLFYHTTKTGRSFTCSRCRAQFDVENIERTMSPADSRRELLNVSHNEYAMCPCCHHTVQVKNEGKARNCVSLRDYRRVLYIKPVSYNKIYMIYAWVEKLFLDGLKVSYNQLPHAYVETVYCLEKGKAVCIKKSNWFREWYETKSIQEPFNKNYAYNYLSNKSKGYAVFGMDKLSETFLKYFDFMKAFPSIEDEGLRDEPIAKAICYAALYPISEFVVKSKFKSFFYSLLNNEPNLRLVNWKAERPKDFFKCFSFQELKECEKNKITSPYLVKAYKRARKLIPKLSITEFKRLLDMSGIYNVDKSAELICEYRLSAKKLINYCRKQEQKYMRSKIYITAIFIVLISIWTFSVKTAKAEVTNSMNICYDTAQNITLEIDEMPYVSSNEETLEYIFEQFSCSEESTTINRSETTCYIPPSIAATQDEGSVDTHARQTVAGESAYSASQFRKLGVVKWGGWRWTWYSEKVLKGNGLKIEGRHKDENGYICDKDGYICCASDVLEFGTVIDTPFGKQGKIYDCGCPSDTIDVYVGW